jgi:hypothetical protein
VCVGVRVCVCVCVCVRVCVRVVVVGVVTGRFGTRRLRRRSGPAVRSRARTCTCSACVRVPARVLVCACWLIAGRTTSLKQTNSTPAASLQNAVVNTTKPSWSPCSQNHTPAHPHSHARQHRARTHRGKKSRTCVAAAGRTSQRRSHLCPAYMPALSQTSASPSTAAAAAASSTSAASTLLPNDGTGVASGGIPG